MRTPSLLLNIIIHFTLRYNCGSFFDCHHTCSISQFDHNAWSNYRIKILYLTSKFSCCFKVLCFIPTAAILLVVVVVAVVLVNFVVVLVVVSFLYFDYTTLVSKYVYMQLMHYTFCTCSDVCTICRYINKIQRCTI